MEESKEVNLYEELSQETERKDASSIAIEKFDFSNPDTPKEETKAGQKSDEQKPEEKKITVSKEDAETSGLTLAMLFDTMTNFGFCLGVKFQTRAKFTKEERDRVKENNLLYVKEDTLSTEDLALKLRWIKSLESQERKFDELASDDKDIERRAKILSKYFKETNTEVSPGWMVVAALIEDIGNKAEAVFLTD